MDGYLLPERKAFIDWYNNEFYRRLIVERRQEEKITKVYQEMLREYINTTTPYRGALVFHGLGTGKTATAITAVEGTGSDWEIITMLPASLESNFKEEIKKFGSQMFRLYDNKTTKWRLTKWESLDSGIREVYTKNYSIDSRYLKNLHKKIYGHSNEKRPAHVFMEDPDGKTIDELAKKAQIFLNAQITRMIEAKYHFMGYRPFRDFRKIDGKYKGIDPSNKLYHRLVRDSKNFGTPFNKNVIIIDEVHSYISIIVNKLLTKQERHGASLVYDWIMRADNCKLVCLSATPVVNKPNEMAVLINMLKGVQKVYTFEIPLMSEENFLEFNLQIKTLFTTNSPVKQYLFQKTRKGILLLSVVRNLSNFVSILDSNGVVRTVPGDNNESEKHFLFHLYDSIQEIYKEVNQGKKQIKPNKETIKTLITKRAKKTANVDAQIFYKEIPAFTIINNEGQFIDCTNNNNFLDIFIDADYNIRSDRRELLLRMCSGCVSYYPGSDKLASEDMAIKNKVTKKYRLEGYSDYRTLEYINIVECPMTLIQFEKYEEERLNENKKIRMSHNRKVVYNYESNMGERKKDNSYHIKSRILGTIVTDDANDIEQILKNPVLLQEYSPKFSELMKKITERNRKCLIYSTFIQNGGLNNIEILLQEANIEFRKVTGTESSAEKQKNIDEFNGNPDIMVMLISEAGAQGISLENVRDVHLMEPHWNFTRIEQVIGRAIRKGSHNSLPKSERNVSIYMYISTLPDEKNTKFLHDESVSEEEKKQLSVRITKLKMMDHSQTMDEYLLSIMERKYKITEQCKEILIEASMDCKQHAKTIPGITCLDFPRELETEDLYFPGISSSKLGLLNIKQVSVQGTKSGNFYTVKATNVNHSQAYLLFYNVGTKKENEVTTNDLKNPVAIVSFTSGIALLENRLCLNPAPEKLICLGNVISLPQSVLNKSEKMTHKDLLKYNNKEHVLGYKIYSESNKKEYFASKNLSNELTDRIHINRMYNWSDYETAGYNENSLQAFAYKNGRIYEI